MFHRFWGPRGNGLMSISTGQPVGIILWKTCWRIPDFTVHTFKCVVAKWTWTAIWLNGQKLKVLFNHGNNSVVCKVVKEPCFVNDWLSLGSRTIFNCHAPEIQSVSENNNGTVHSHDAEVIQQHPRI